jgi:hypothetical protein
MTLRTTYIGFAILGASILIAGCGGGSQAPMMAGLPSGSNQMQAPADQGRNHQGCPSDGGITVTPCRIKFNSNNPGPTNVTVTHGGQSDGNRHTIKERDDCASRNIATVARDSNRMYTVTAGSATGSCTAQFSNNGNQNDDGGGGQNGGGTLKIVNNL